MVYILYATHKVCVYAIESDYCLCTFIQHWYVAWNGRLGYKKGNIPCDRSLVDVDKTNLLVIFLFCNVSTLHSAVGRMRGQGGAVYHRARGKLQGRATEGRGDPDRRVSKPSRPLRGIGGGEEGPHQRVRIGVQVKRGRLDSSWGGGALVSEARGQVVGASGIKELCVCACACVYLLHCT